MEPRTRNLRVATESAAYTLRNLALSVFLCHALRATHTEDARGAWHLQGGNTTNGRGFTTALIQILTFPHTTSRALMRTQPWWARARRCRPSGLSSGSWDRCISLLPGFALRVVIFCSPFAVHLASFVWCFPSGAYRGRRDATGACALSQTSC